MGVADEAFFRDLYNVGYLFGDKWVKAIIGDLINGPRRRVEILSAIRSHPVADEWWDKHAVLHDSILTRTLKKMTAEGLVVREEKTDTFPVQVYYSLTPAVYEFLEAAAPAVEWIRRHPEIVERAQAFSRNHGGEVEALTGLSGLAARDAEPDDDNSAASDAEDADQAEDDRDAC